MSSKNDQNADTEQSVLSLTRKANKFLYVALNKTALCRVLRSQTSFEENLNDGCKNKAKTSSKKVGGDFEQRFVVVRFTPGNSV